MEKAFQFAKYLLKFVCSPPPVNMKRFFVREISHADVSGTKEEKLWPVTRDDVKQLFGQSFPIFSLFSLLSQNVHACVVWQRNTWSKSVTLATGELNWQSTIRAVPKSFLSLNKLHDESRPSDLVPRSFVYFEDDYKFRQQRVRR